VYVRVFGRLLAVLSMLAVAVIAVPDPASALGRFCASAPSGWVKVRSVNPTNDFGVADTSVELAVYTDGMRSLVAFANRFANGKQHFIAEAHHGASDLGTTTSILAGSTFCSNTAPGQVIGNTSYFLDNDTVFYLGSVAYP
jgi:hypothetical protein